MGTIGPRKMFRQTGVKLPKDVLRSQPPDLQVFVLMWLTTKQMSTKRGWEDRVASQEQHQAEKV